MMWRFRWHRARFALLRMALRVFKNFLWGLVNLDIFFGGKITKNNKISNWLTFRLEDYYAYDRFLRLFCDDRAKIAYFNLEKTASGSFKKALIEHRVTQDGMDFPSKKMGDAHFYFTAPSHWCYFGGDLSVVTFIYHNTPPILTSAVRTSNKNLAQKYISQNRLEPYIIFTFVRNPFARLVSCFNQKYEFKDGAYQCTINEIFSNFAQLSSFSDFINKIYRHPLHFLEPHMAPYSDRIEHFEKSGLKIDFIGRFENIKEDYQRFKKQFDLENLPPMRHSNISKKPKKDWRDYYTPSLAKKVYRRYRKDFIRFGYEDEYDKLRDYLKKNKPSRKVKS